MSPNIKVQKDYQKVNIELVQDFDVETIRVEAQSNLNYQGGGDKYK